LTETLDESEHPCLDEVNYSDGVLNVIFTDGKQFVLNKQTPNKQIWLSSPLSGPQRFEFAENEQWLQVRSSENLTELLESEFNTLIKAEGDEYLKL
jgi:frataxin